MTVFTRGLRESAREDVRRVTQRTRGEVGAASGQLAQDEDTLTADLASVMAVRDEVMADHRAASTLVTVPALARSEWLIEISLVAAS